MSDNEQIDYDRGENKFIDDTNLDEDHFPEEGERFRLVVHHDLLRIYIVKKVHIQYQCELGPESLVELHYFEEGFFDPMWITVEALRLMMETEIFVLL